MNQPASIPPCPICAAARQVRFQGVLLRRHSVDYWHCEECGLLQTQTPYWLDEAYGEAITRIDTGVLARNWIIARQLRPLLYFAFGAEGRYLDAAGGYGVLARLMRDAGFDFFWWDPYCENLHARGFEWSGGAAIAVTATEVLEHVHDPRAFLAELIARGGSRNLVLTTETYAGAPPPLEAWPYYATASGQHVSFYQQRTLLRLARDLGLHYARIGLLHVMTEQRLSAMLRRLLGNAALARVAGMLACRRLQPRTLSDHLQLAG